MATVTKKTTTTGNIRYKADIRIKRSGRIIHRESRTFDRKRLADEWAKAREVELQSDAGLERVKYGAITIGRVLETYEAHFKPEAGFGRTKTYDLARLLASPLSKLPAVSLTTKDLLNHCHHRKQEGAAPATINNDITWLAVVFKAVRASEGWPLDLSVIEDARVIMRQHGLIARSARRDRRPTKEELWKLSRYFWRKQNRSRAQIPMLDIMWFQIYSARRDAETCRILWSDNNNEKQTGMVRDAKHPRKKQGNHRRFKFHSRAWRIAQRQPKTDERIFPYNPKSVSAAFARACGLLGIEDLRLHDLRHEATSRLFEQGYSIEQVQLFTLHEDWAMLKRYTHLKPEDL